MTTTQHKPAFHVGDAVWVKLGTIAYPGTVAMTRDFADGSTWLKISWYDDEGFRTSIVEDRHCKPRWLD